MTDESKTQNDIDLWNAWCKKYVDRIKRDLENFNGTRVTYHKERNQTMRDNNPRFILRNHIAEEAIQLAENEDYSLVQKLIQLIEDPYNHSFAEIKSETIEKGSNTARCDTMTDKSPNWAFSIKVS